MKAKIKTQKGFIQIPLLIIIIASIVVVSVGTGIILHKQIKLFTSTANISEALRTKTIEIEKKLKPRTETVFESECPTCPPCEPKIITKEVPVEKIVEKPVIKEVIKEVPVEKIVYKETCSCPPIQPETSQEQFITYSGSEFGGKIDDYFPVITSFSADPSPSAARLKIGDEIHLKVEATDPYERQILYRWWCSTCGFAYDYDKERIWTTNNEIKYKITAEDIKKSGESMRIGVYIKSEKEYYRRGEHGYDDGIYIDYKFSF